MGANGQYEFAWVDLVDQGNPVGKCNNGFHNAHSDVPFARLAMLVGVFASLLVCFVMLFVTTIVVIRIVKHGMTYGTATVSIASVEATQLEQQRADTVVHIVQSIDGYLLAAIMLIFAFG